MIGVAITTRNRNEIAKRTVINWRNCMTDDMKLVIVDDASDVPFEGADFRFEKQAGIAAAKNKCLELLEDCEHIFLSDDDIWPVKLDWWIPYVNSGEGYLCYTFDRYVNGQWTGKIPTGESEDFIYWKEPNGCLQYLTKKTLQTIGGFDTRFKIYAYEHVEYARRAHLAGCCTHANMDVKKADDIWYSMDRQLEIITSVPERFDYVPNNKHLLDSDIHTKNLKYK
jgi:glycosyltransferase involved in cell wall biosynthesis